MSRKPRPIPPLIGDTFTTQTARTAGVTQHQLYRGGLLTPFSGVRMLPDQPHQSGGTDQHPHDIWRQTQVANARAYSRVMPDRASFSHRTAAAIWRLPIAPPPQLAVISNGLTHMDEAELGLRVYLEECAALGQDVAAELDALNAREQGRSDEFRELWARIQVSAPLDTPSIRRKGVQAARIKRALLTITEHRGLRVTDPATTWALAAASMNIEEAVALGDAVIHQLRYPGTDRLERPPLATLADLQRALDLGRRPGIRHLRSALNLLSPHAASPPESHLRLKLRDWALPLPELDYDVYDARGRLLGASEFAWPWIKLVIEQEGDHHRTQTRQWNRDISKVHDYNSAGWETIRSTARSLYHEPQKLREYIENRITERIARVRLGSLTPEGPWPDALPERFRAASIVIR